MTTALKLTYKPQQKTKVLIDAIDNERARDVLVRRYGLSGDSPETLESVGQSYGITRERVRQIENHALKTIRKSEYYGAAADELRELAQVIEELGGIAAQNELLEILARKNDERQHVLFLLAVGDEFGRKKEGNEFVHHWYLDESKAHSVRKALENLYTALDDAIVLPEEEIISRYKEELNKESATRDEEEVLLRWLSLYKRIGRNPLGEWGKATSPSVHVKGMRDFAYLTLKRHGSPMHFSEVAQKVEELFGRKAHVATTHNELIKDPRFVLVGRGLYALGEWGYAKGVVKDVIRQLLEEHGPLTKNEIIERVKRERYVKDNTIAVNLQDTSVFESLDDGRYALAT